MVQQDADALGLGVEVVGFTVGGMHPPVMVAPDYQAVVSAELGKVTAVVNAQVFPQSKRCLPPRLRSLVGRERRPRRRRSRTLARRRARPGAFARCESQYRAAPQEYLFRRRLETLEKGLARHAVSRSSIPASSGTEVSCG